MPVFSHQHSIADTSPLLIDRHWGYLLLQNLAELPKKGIFDFSITAPNSIEDAIYYYTEHIDNCRTLADFTYGRECMTKDILLKAWACVEHSVDDLARVSGLIDIRSAPTWNAINNRFLQIQPDSHIAQCNQCDIFMKSHTTQASDVVNILCHGDLHSGNFVLYNDEFKLIDLENIHIAPALSDYFLFSCLVPNAHTFLTEKLSKAKGTLPNNLSLPYAGLHAIRIASILRALTSGPSGEDIDHNIHMTIAEFERYKSSFFSSLS